MAVSSGDDKRISSVSIDDKEVSIKAMNYLLSIGKKKIALLNSTLDYKFARHREEGYRQALKKAGIPVNEQWIVHLHPDFRIDSAISASERILQSEDKPDAFFAVSDLYAAAILRACKRMKISVPDEVAVIAFDNTNITTISEPTLTSINQPTFQMRVYGLLFIN